MMILRGGEGGGGKPMENFPKSRTSKKGGAIKNVMLVSSLYVFIIYTEIKGL